MIPRLLDGEANEIARPFVCSGFSTREIRGEAYSEAVWTARGLPVFRRVSLHMAGRARSYPADTVARPVSNQVGRQGRLPNRATRGRLPKARRNHFDAYVCSAGLRVGVRRPHR